MSIYERTHAAIARAISETGHPAELALEKTPNAERRTTNAELTNACFANPVRADVLLNGRKIAGAAQRRTRRGLLQQGSIQNVEVGNGFEFQFASQLSGSCVDRLIAESVLQRAREVAKNKYAAESWLRKR